MRDSTVLSEEMMGIIIATIFVGFLVFGVYILVVEDMDTTRRTEKETVEEIAPRTLFGTSLPCDMKDLTPEEFQTLKYVYARETAIATADSCKQLQLITLSVVTVSFLWVITEAIPALAKFVSRFIPW